MPFVQSNNVELDRTIRHEMTFIQTSSIISLSLSFECVCMFTFIYLKREHFSPANMTVNIFPATIVVVVVVDDKFARVTG